MTDPHASHIRYSINVRRLGFLVHQQAACSCELYELLSGLNKLFPGDRYSISFQKSQEDLIDIPFLRAENWV